MSGYFCEALQKKKNEETQKKKLPKHVERMFFLKKNPPTRNGQKRGDFFRDEKTERRDFHAFTESCRQRKNTKSERKRRKSLVKRSTPKNEKTKGWKTYGKQ